MVTTTTVPQTTAVTAPTAEVTPAAVGAAGAAASPETGRRLAEVSEEHDLELIAGVER